MANTPKHSEARKKRLKRLTEQLLESVSDLSDITGRGNDFSMMPSLDLECKFKKRGKRKHCDDGHKHCDDGHKHCD
ncbi:hypothetical protein, partial [Metabacillus fastidiosus]